MHEINIKYRTWHKGKKPSRINLEIPGWAGERNWKCGQPWHCKPFRDGSTYGLELIYPFDTETTVTTKNDELIFTGDFSKEKCEGQDWERPFSSFAPHHFGFTSSLDIQTEPGYGLFLLPHPRYYTDRTGTVPLPVGGILESDFWPRIFFVVFKSPLEGQTYVFRKDESYAQITIVPKEIKYNIQKMTPEEEKARGELDKILNDHWRKLSTKTWETDNKGIFDNKYKVLSSMAKKDGLEEVSNYIKQAGQEQAIEQNEKMLKARNKFKRRIIHGKG